MQVTATIVSSHPRTQTFDLARPVDHAFGAEGKARLFYFAPYDSRLGRRNVLCEVVWANTISEIH